MVAAVFDKLTISCTPDNSRVARITSVVCLHTAGVVDLNRTRTITRCWIVLDKYKVIVYLISGRIKTNTNSLSRSPKVQASSQCSSLIN
eukprot:scaffold4226_cov180-Amphora_coffeaeformis.AAC.4